MIDTIFIQPGRRGDIVNILPLMQARAQAGEHVYCVVHAEFADVLRAVTYVTPIIWDGSSADVAGATDFARAIMPAATVIASQVNGAAEPCPIRFRNFALENWYRAGGKLGDYHRLPLVLDAPRRSIPRTGRIRIGVATGGVSSPFPEGLAFLRWLERAVGNAADVIHLDGEQLPSAIDLIPLIESCDVCILNDSLPLHFSYAIKKPVVAILRSTRRYKKAQDASWDSTEPRDHWVLAMPQEECLTNVGKSRIASVLQDLLGITLNDVQPLIVQCVDWYKARDPDERRRMERARDSWDRQSVLDGHWKLHEHRARPGRTSRDELGDSRTLPFIKDMIDAACADSDIGVITNSDIILDENAGQIIREKCTPCCYSARIDITRQGSEIAPYGGVDLIAFRSDWWREHRDEYPDFLLGCEGWDAVIWMWLGPEARLSPMIRHEIHRPFWSRSENHIDNMGQRYNRALATLWMIKNGKQNKFGKGNCLILG